MLFLFLLFKTLKFPKKNNFIFETISKKKNMAQINNDSIKKILSGHRILSFFNCFHH